MSELYDILKIAAALIVFNWVKPPLGKLTQNWGSWGSLAADAAAVIISAALVHLVTGKILERPKVTIEWMDDRVAARGPCVQLVAAASGGGVQGYNVQLSYEGESWVSKLVSYCCSKWGAVATVTVSPTDAVMLVREIGPAHPTASCSQGVISFTLSGDLAAGMCSWLDVSLQMVNAPSLVELKCAYTIKLGRLNEWWSGRVIPVSSAVEKFEVRSSP